MIGPIQKNLLKREVDRINGVHLAIKEELQAVRQEDLITVTALQVTEVLNRLDKIEKSIEQISIKLIK